MLRNRDFQNFVLLVKLARRFGFSIAFKSFLDTVARRLPFEEMYHRTHQARYGACKQYLLKNYHAEIVEQVKKYNALSVEELKVLDKQSNIWFFWWQGIENAPDLVKTCVKSIKLWAGDRKVVFLSKDNYREYIEMPTFMYKKLNAGSISLAHFSDVLRLMLLSEYGGVWVDSTLLMSGKFLDLIDGYSFYTVKHKTDEGWHISDGSWATFFLAAAPEDPVISFCRDMLLAYWEKEDCLLCYLVFDCFLSIGYDSVPIIRREIDLVPVNNTGVFDMLYGQRHDIVDMNQLQEVLNRAQIHKLTYKQKYNEEVGSKRTLYGMVKAIALRLEE